MDKKVVKNGNNKLSLYPLEFEEAVKGFLEVKPKIQGSNAKSLKEDKPIKRGGILWLQNQPRNFLNNWRALRRHTQT